MMDPAVPDVPQVPCPLCESVLKKPHRAKKLNGIAVCKRCRNGFANRRQCAYIIDSVAWAIIVTIPLSFLEEAFYSPGGAGGGSGLLSSLLGFDSVLGFIYRWIIPLAYFCKDGFSGMSLGKHMMGVQVVDQDSREPIGFKQSLQRNLILIIPLGFLFVLGSMMKGRRWGDGWAKTTVIWRKYAFKTPFDPRGILCLSCGYNLTGNVSGRCPECFTPVRGAAQDVPAEPPPKPRSCQAARGATRTLLAV